MYKLEQRADGQWFIVCAESGATVDGPYETRAGAREDMIFLEDLDTEGDTFEVADEIDEAAALEADAVTVHLTRDQAKRLAKLLEGAVASAREDNEDDAPEVKELTAIDDAVWTALGGSDE